MECKNKRFYKQAHVWPEREPPAVHSSGVETKAVTPQTKKKSGSDYALTSIGRDWSIPTRSSGGALGPFQQRIFTGGGGTKREKKNAGRRCRLAVRV